MTTLHSSLGPNPRLVRMFMIEKGLEEGRDFARVHYDIITGANRQDAAYMAKNPQGTTPTLELDDGTCLTESWPICEYVEELHPTPNLFGATPVERAEVRKWARLFDQEVVVPMTMGFRAGAGRPMAWVWVSRSSTPWPRAMEAPYRAAAPPTGPASA